MFDYRNANSSIKAHTQRYSPKYLGLSEKGAWPPNGFYMLLYQHIVIHDYIVSIANGFRGTICSNKQVWFSVPLPSFHPFGAPPNCALYWTLCAWAGPDPAVAKMTAKRLGDLGTDSPTWSCDKWVELGQICGFPQIGVPKMDGFIMEHPFKIDDLGVPPFQETPIWCSLPK